MNAPFRDRLKIAVPMVSDAAFLAHRMRADEIAQFLAVHGLTRYDPEQAARTFIAAPGESYVLLDDANLPVLMGGFIPIRPGVYEGWQVGTDELWAKHWRLICKVSRRMIDGFFERDDVHRIQICAVASRESKTFMWYERGLGMQREALIRRYCGNGEDAIMFARTK